MNNVPHHTGRNVSPELSTEPDTAGTEGLSEKRLILHLHEPKGDCCLTFCTVGISFASL